MADVSLLSDYLASIGARRWQVGVLDCGVFMADWVRALTGQDPIADIRGRYASEAQFLRIIRREGGFRNCVAQRLAAVGLHKVAAAGAGDIVVVLAPYAKRRDRIQSRPTGGIAVSSAQRAVITADMGLVIAGDPALPIVEVFRWH